MADQSTQSITVDAPAADVMAVIADFPAYPKWVAAAKQVDGDATITHREGARSAVGRRQLHGRSPAKCTTVQYGAMDDGTAAGRQIREADVVRGAGHEKRAARLRELR